MNCLYIILLFNIVAGIVQTFIKSWNKLLYPRVIEVCRQPFQPRHDLLHLIIVVEIPSENSRHHFRHILPIHNATTNSSNSFVNFRWTLTFCAEKSYDETHLAFGRTLDRRCHLKHVSLKQSRFSHCQTSTAHR